MLLTFPSDKSIEMTFKVGIAGTQTAPSNVAVVLERNGQALSYVATKNGDDWTARIDSPGKTFGAGEVKMCVNVMLNNRLFTPLKSMAQIVDEVAPTVKMDEPPQEKIQDVQNELPEPEQVEEQQVEKITAEEIKPVDEEKIKKVKDLLLQAQAAADKKKEETTKAPIRMQLLKLIEPGQKAKQPVKESSTDAAPSSLFSIKKTKIVFQ